MTSGYFFLLGTPSDPMPERPKSTNKHSLEWEIILVLLHEHTTILELTASYDSPDRTWLSPHSHIQPFWVCFTSGLALDAFPRKKSRFWILILKSPGVNRGICTHASLTRRVCGGIVYHTDSKGPSINDVYNLRGEGVWISRQKYDEGRRGVTAKTMSFCMRFLSLHIIHFYQTFHKHTEKNCS